MGFATSYLEERALFPQRITEAPDTETGIIVVVPAYNETGIVNMLDSLARCRAPQCKVEVIVVVNAPASASRGIVDTNIRCIEDIESWKCTNKSSFFRLFIFDTGSHSYSGWGVGMARKTGMDEALRRFDQLARPDGVILNLDADCRVKENYLTAVENDFLRRKERSACSIYFEHPVAGEEFQQSQYSAITLYELHLRFYYQGLIYSGFPDVFHTVGSAIAVKALPYVKAGGMNRKQAGEDFYFIQKLIPQGGYIALNSTTVYPSPRSSGRVPFGTGATMGKMESDPGAHLMTYNVEAFNELRYLTELTGKLYNASSSDLEEIFNSLPPGLKMFTGEDEWIGKTAEIRKNTATYSSFSKRFFSWFNMFRVVKYMNFVHDRIFEKQPVEVSAMKLLAMKGMSHSPADALSLLMHYRLLERQD